ncbi:MAG: GNAT family protein [Angelakisella sp.]
MDLKIEPVTKQNRAAVTALRVKHGQEHFVETVEECLTEADQFALWRPVAVYDGAQLIGFCMYGLWGNNGRVWLDRFLLDAGSQGKGYSIPVLRALIARIREEYGCDELYLSVYKENTLALSIYQRLGFALNGELDINGEEIMVLPCKSLSVAKGGKTAGGAKRIYSVVA